MPITTGREGRGSEETHESRSLASRAMDESYMKIALELAAKARGRTSPNPMAGAVIVKEGNIVGRGYHLQPGTPHAEVNALNEAGKKAKGGTLYVTLEPCCHYGRTGPCTEAIIQAGVTKVVAAMIDPNPLVSGKGFKRLRDAGIEVVCGVLENEARRLNEVFIKYITTGMPFIVAKAAISLDGKIATRSGKSKWITGPVTRAYGHQMRDWYDAVMVGIGTVLADDPLLSTRLPGGGGRDPVRVILDSQARIPLNARVLNQQSKAPTIIAVTASVKHEKLEALRLAGAQVLVVGGGHRVDVAALMKMLGKRGITSVLIEGGAGIHGAAIPAGIADKAAWFIAPIIIGGLGAPGPVGGLGVDELSEAPALEIVEVRSMGQDIYVEAYFKREKPCQDLNGLSDNMGEGSEPSNKSNPLGPLENTGFFGFIP